MSSTFRGSVLQDEFTGCNDIDDTWRNSYNKIDCISVELLQRGCGISRMERKRKINGLQLFI